MRNHHNFDESQTNYDKDIEYKYDENSDEMIHKRQVRRMLEEKLERKRLRQEIEDDLDDEFNWDDVSK